MLRHTYRAIKDWTQAFENQAHIPNGQAWLDDLPKSALYFRQTLSSSKFTKLDVSYGDHSRQAYDLFFPDSTTPPSGIAIFIHGGYWMATSKDDYSHLAAGLLKKGMMVALPSYRLCPEVKLGDITRDVTAAINHIIEKIDDLDPDLPILLMGHSAGGHLTARMLCDDTAIKPEYLPRIKGGIAISGLFDLRPFLKADHNQTLGLDDQQVKDESPIYHAPFETIAGHCPQLHLWVGAAERPEFIRQSTLMSAIWAGLGHQTSMTIEPDCHHFSVIDGLADPDHPLVGFATSFLNP